MAVFTRCRLVCASWTITTRAAWETHPLFHSGACWELSAHFSVAHLLWRDGAALLDSASWWQEAHRGGRTGSSPVYMDSNEGFPSVNNNMRGTKDVPFLLKALEVLRNRKKREGRRCIKQGILKAVLQEEQGKSFSGCSCYFQAIKGPLWVCITLLCVC